MVLPVIFLSMAVLLTVFFVCLSAISENSKIHIGVVVPEKGFMERGLLEYVSNMADTKALCVFRELSETEAKEQLDEVHAPIGIPLGGQLPEEIAVSIMAEIIKVKNQHYSAYCDEKVETAVLEGRHGVMVTIAEKSGSSPRGVGSKMFVEPSGHITGSIGGGKVEYEAINHCKEVKEKEVKHYALTADGQDSLGMICGGQVTVVFERV